MAFTVTYYGQEGRASAYTRIQRKLDGYWWNNSTKAWVAVAVAACNLTLVEDGTIKGKYVSTADAALVPQTGGLYSFWNYDSAGDLLLMTEQPQRPEAPTLLTMIQKVQQKLRLPQAAAITETHAALMMEFLNQAQTLMMEGASWDELGLKGAFGTRDGQSLYFLFPANGAMLEGIDHLQIGTGTPLSIINDERFRAMKRQYTTGAEPIFARLYGRAGNAIILEVLPEPDATYQVDFEARQKPLKLTAATDVPLLDSDTIVAGALLLAKAEQGDDSSAEQAAFNAHLGGRVSVAAESDWGDVEPV